DIGTVLSNTLMHALNETGKVVTEQLVKTGNMVGNLFGDDLFFSRFFDCPSIFSQLMAKWKSSRGNAYSDPREKKSTSRQPIKNENDVAKRASLRKVEHVGPKWANPKNLTFNGSMA